MDLELPGKDEGGTEDQETFVVDEVLFVHQHECGGGDQSEGEIENRDDGRISRGSRAALFGPHQVEFPAGDQRRRKGREQEPRDLEKAQSHGIEDDRAAQNRTEQRVKKREQESEKWKMPENVQATVHIHLI